MGVICFLERENDTVLKFYMNDLSYFQISTSLYESLFPVIKRNRVSTH